MKSFIKKAMATVLVIALCLGGVSIQKQKASAANAYIVLDTTTEAQEPSAKPNEVVSRSFTLSLAGNLDVGVYTYEKCDFTCEITNKSGKTVFDQEVTAFDNSWATDSTGYPLYVVHATDLVAGNYNFRIIFSNDQAFDLIGLFYPSATAVVPSLDSTKLTITKGFKDKISVINAGGATITYKSNNKKVATVDSKGNVTGKSKGTAKITVTTSTGYTGTCTVTVKDNVYNVSKLSLGQVPGGKFIVDVYNVSYDKKGNLVIKTRMLNNRGFTAKYLKNFKITIKDEKGKKIGVYSETKKTINLKSGKAKAYTFTIKKNKLNNKNADLRTSEPKVSGTYYYNY